MERMGKAEGIALVALLIIPRTFLASMIESVDIAAGLGWLMYIITGSISLVIGLAVIFILKNFKGDLLDTVEILLGRRAFYGAGIFYAALFLTNAVLLLRQFAQSTMVIGLKNTQIDIIIALYAVLGGLVIYFGIEALARTASIVLPFVFLWILLEYILLIPVCNIYNLAPWQGTGAGTVVYNSILAAGVDVGVLVIAILAPAFQNAETKINSVFWGSLSAAFFKITSIFVFLAAVGVEAGREKGLPFFEMASRIYLDRSFQRLEDFTVLLWVNIGVLSIGLSLYIFLYLAARMLRLSTIRPLVPVSCVIIYLLANIPRNISDIIQADFKITQIFFGFGLYVIPGILAAAFLYKKYMRVGCR